jgi:hypothetical protein
MYGKEKREPFLKYHHATEKYIRNGRNI